MATEQKQTMRNGKTDRDHASKAWNHRFANRAKRVDWEHSDRPGTRFPWETCNGKKNRQNLFSKKSPSPFPEKE